MATVKAVKSGNWSDPTVWSTGALPQTGDDVYANTFTVQCDTTATVLSIQNGTTTGVTAGGNFNLKNGVTLTATANNGFVSGAVANSILFSFSEAAPSVVSLAGNATGHQVSSTTSTVVAITNTGTLNFVGNVVCVDRTSGNGAFFGFNISAAATLNVTGNLTAALSGGSAPAIQVTAAANITITGNVTGGASYSYSATGAGITVTGAATITITGSITPTSSVGGFWSNAAHKLTCVGAVYGYGTPSGGTVQTAGGIGVLSSHANGLNLFSGPLVCSSNGYMPFAANRVFWIPTLNTSFKFYQYGGGAGGAATYLYSPDTYADAPAPANVRAGVSYTTGLYTGTMAVPAYDDVAKNVQVGPGVGEAVFDPAAVWEVQTSVLTTSGSIGERLKNAATVDSTGAQIAALK